MEHLPSGTIALSVFGLLFFGLQAYWISQTFRSLSNDGEFDQSLDQLSETKRKLEKLFKQ